MAVRRAAIIVGAALVAVAGLLLLRAVISTDPLDRLRRVEGGDAGREERAGSWWFPRGGPYVLGFESPGPAELLIDGRVVASGQGEVKARVVYPAPGARAVVFRAPRGARLLWHPPGRRGAPEYVPPSSLSPDPPDRARFGRWPGASPDDAAIATAIVLVLLAAGLLLARPRVDRRALLAAGLVVGVALAARLVALAGAEQTWDEDEYWSSGRNYLLNLLSLDFRPDAWRWNYAHPPLTKYLGGLGALWMDGYGAARFVFVLLGAGTCALVFAVGRRLFGARAGVLAGLTAALLPRLVAHDVVVGHESPTVFLWTLAVLLALRAHDDERLLARRLAWVGVALGLAGSVRFANVFLAPLVGIVLLLRSPRPLVRRTLALGALVVPAAAAVTFYAIWPRLWGDPVGHLRFAFGLFRVHHAMPEYYLGRFGPTSAWHYFPVYFLVTTPLLILLAGFGLGTWRLAARREAGAWVLLAWLLAPFGTAWSPLRQDGVRYVLHALVPLALACGAGIDHLADRIRWRRAGQAATALLGVYLAVACARVHPYYLDYYGEHVGGAGTVARRRWFEVGGWGEGIGAAVAWVNARAARDARVARLLQPTHVNWLRGDLWRDTAPASADWIVVNDLGLFAQGIHGAYRPPPRFRLVHETGSQGMALVRVYRRE